MASLGIEGARLDEELLRILVVDSTEAIPTQLSTAFSTTEYDSTVKSVSSGTAGLTTLDEEGEYDAVIVSYELQDGDLNGLELLAQLPDQLVNGVPFVFISDYEDADVIETAIERGANQCLPRCPESAGWYRAVANAVVTEIENQRTLTKLAQTQDELRRIHDTAPVMITRKDTENRLLTVNKAVEDYLDLPREEIQGKTAEELFPEYGDQFYEMDRRVIDSGEPIRRETQRLSTPSGEDRWIQTDALPYEDADGNVEGVLIVSEDITELKRSEQELARQNERLDEFGRILSHDLRNPLNVAVGRLELAREAHDSEHLDAIAGALDRMEALIDDTLTLARQGHQASDLETVNLSELVTTCWHNVDTVEASLVTETDQEIRADQGRLQQLLENLFSNAVEHGGGGVNITVGDLDHESGFYVADDGSGIPKTKRSEVFEMGYSSSEGGTGFGLSIVKQVAEAHGWETALVDSTEGGARFEFTGVKSG